MGSWLQLLLGMAVAPGMAFLGWRLFLATTVHVEDGEAVLVEWFGRRVMTLTEPGAHWLPRRILPWMRVQHVSLRRDFLRLENVHVTDVEGTTVMVDLWIDHRVVDAAKATYSVERLDEALRSLVAHAATALLGRRTFWEILASRSDLGERLRADIAADTERWGVCIEHAFVQKVSLLPEVTSRILESLSARLGRVQAEILEQGRIEVAALEARTGVEVAALVAEAKGQYPAAVGRAMSELGKSPEILSAYNELHRLSVLRPHRATAFVGFGPHEMSAIEAAMIPARAEPADG